MCLSPIGILRANHVIKPPPAVKIQRHFISNGPLRLPAGRTATPQPVGLPLESAPNPMHEHQRGLTTRSSLVDARGYEGTPSWAFLIVSRDGRTPRGGPARAAPAGAGCSAAASPCRRSAHWLPPRSREPDRPWPRASRPRGSPRRWRQRRRPRAATSSSKSAATTTARSTNCSGSTTTGASRATRLRRQGPPEQGLSGQRALRSGRHQGRELPEVGTDPGHRPERQGRPGRVLLDPEQRLGCQQHLRLVLQRVIPRGRVPDRQQ